MARGASIAVSGFSPATATAGAARLPAQPLAARDTALGFAAESPSRPGRLLLSDPISEHALQVAVGTLPAAAGRSFRPRSVERDILGQVHLRMDVLQDGARIFGKQVIVHLGPDGALLGTTGTERLPGMPVRSARPPIGAERAVDLALQAFGHPADSRPRGERVFVPAADGTLVEAYRVDLESSATGTRGTLLISAAEGALLQRLQRDGTGGEHGANGSADATTGAPALPLPAKTTADSALPLPATTTADSAPSPPRTTASDSAPTAGDDRTLYSGYVELGTRPEADGTHLMQDLSRGKGIVVLDTRNTTDPKNVVEIRDDNGSWGQASDPRKHDAAVDVMFGAQLTYDFLQELFGRDSIDGAGEALVAHINLGKSNHNAYWNGSVIKFGPGDKDGTAGPLVSLDVLGHELTHGLTERTADLVYAGESGALNEAWSDIFGTGVEWYAAQKNPAFSFDWKLAEDGWTPATPGDALRYLDDPTRDGVSVDHYRQLAPRMDVHHSSGIANNAFYLLVSGGQHRSSGLSVEQGIGMEPGLQIFYRALSVYMTPDTDFAGARAATLQAATDLFGAESVQVRSVSQAWSAVGVGSPAPSHSAAR